MAYNDFKRYIWLIALLRNVKEATKQDICEAWQDDPLNPDNQEMPDRTFYNHLKAIKEIFGITIARSGTDKKFRIVNETMPDEEMDVNAVRMQESLLQAIAINQSYNSFPQTKGRVLTEENTFLYESTLPKIFRAMDKNRKIRIRYRKFGDTETSVRTVSPYCIREYKHNWYLLAKDEAGQLKTFSADASRMRNVSVLEERFDYPADFNAEDHFYSAIGVRTGTPEEIVLKAYGQEADYLWTFPIHHSQMLRARGNGYAVFYLDAAPDTPELLQELLSRGDRVEVLRPRALRDAVAAQIDRMHRRYADPREGSVPVPENGGAVPDGEVPGWDAAAGRERAGRGDSAADEVRIEAACNNNQIFAAGAYRTDSGQIVMLPPDGTSLRETLVYSEEVRLTGCWPMSAMGTRTAVVNDDCLRVARRMQQGGRLNPAVLNLADADRACGFYFEGYPTQEESLCRSSTLSRSLYQYYSPDMAAEAGVPFVRAAYPMDLRFGGIYSPDVTVFRDNADGYALLEEPFQVSIISVAALNFLEYGGRDLAYRAEDGGFTPEGESIMKDKIRTIFRIALLGGHNSLVLGAFGCGAFRLRSDLVAALFREILLEEEFYGRFLEVRFALLEPGLADWHESRFRPFYDLFSGENDIV